MVWIEKVGWQVEGIANYGLNVVSFVLTTGRRRWYVMGAYVPPNVRASVHRVEQALRAAPKRLELILIGYLNAGLG